MKKLFVILLLALALMLTVGVAVAEGVAAYPAAPTDFFTWATIGTFAGAVAMTVFIVQAVKMPLDKVLGHVPTRLIVYLIALALLLMSQGFINGGLNVETIALSVVNGFLVMLAAMSTYTMLIEQTEARKQAKLANEHMNEKKVDQETEPPDVAAVSEQ